MKMLCAALLIFCQTGLAFTFSNHTKYPAEIDYVDYGWFLDTHYHITVYPGQIGVKSKDTIEPHKLIGIKISALDRARGKWTEWSNAKVHSGSSFDLIDSQVKDSLMLSVNGGVPFFKLP